MNIMKYQNSVSFAIALVIWIIIFWQIYPIASDVGCWKAKLIARNDDKTDYLRNWIKESLSNPDFLELEKTNPIRRDFSPTREEFAAVNFDIEYLGMDLSGAGIVLNRDFNPNYMDPTNITSVSFTQGRKSIVIKVDGSKEYGVWIGENRKRTDISDDVMVLC